MTPSEKTQNKMLLEQIFLCLMLNYLGDIIADDPDKFFAFIDQQTKERKLI